MNPLHVFDSCVELGAQVAGKADVLEFVQQLPVTQPTKDSKTAPDGASKISETIGGSTHYTPAIAQGRHGQEAKKQ